LQWRVKVVTKLICLFESVSQTERREAKGEIGGGEREREREREREISYLTKY